MFRFVILLVCAGGKPGISKLAVSAIDGQYQIRVRKPELFRCQYGGKAKIFLIQTIDPLFIDFDKIPRARQ
jgi:hypothetical protein